MGEDARNNAVECVDCQALGPVHPTMARARQAASSEGWARNYHYSRGGEFWRCPSCRRREPSDGHQRGSRSDRRLSVVLPADLHDQIANAAADRDVSTAWIVRRALEDFLSRLSPASEFTLTRPAAGTDGGGPDDTERTT